MTKIETNKLSVALLSEFQKAIGVNFKDTKLLERVFIHRSYLNETRLKLEHNERLEFLGDAVLELITTEYLYKNFSQPEGILTNWRSALVRGENLSKLAQKLEINELILLSRGEAKGNGKSRQLILANALEALIGAIYLDQGYLKAKEFVTKYLIKDLPEILETKTYLDPKSQLQEYIQEKDNITPQYKVLKEEGPDHSRIFQVAVLAHNKILGEGRGSSKQEAEQSAAKGALKKLSLS